MYPLRLYLKNFLSYGEKGVEIDFGSYHTLLLLGQNGAGKSSILDAILWAIWGKTRFGGDTDIMHTGSSDMEVRLDIVIKDHPYRIIRKRSKKGKSFVSVLELQSLTEPITLLTDATILKTQEKINELVGVSYEILISSAFLRQGDAQEFTQKSPSKRKELLASLLRLDQYQVWQDESKKQLREIDNQLLTHAGQKQYLEQESQRLSIEIGTLQTQIDLTDLPALENKIQQYQEEIQNHEKTQQVQKEQQEKINFLNKNCEQVSQKLQNSITKISTLQQEESQLLQKLGTEPHPISVEQLTEINERFERVQRAQIEKASLIKKQAQLLKQINTSREQNQKQLDKKQHELLRLQSDALLKKHPILELEKKVTESISAQKELPIQQEKLIQLSGTIGGLEQELQLTIQQGNLIKEKKNKLEHLGDACPLCEQKVDTPHKEAIAHKYEQERDQLLSHYNQLKGQKDALTKEKDSIQATVEALRIISDCYAELQKAQSLYEHIEQLKNQLQEQKDVFEVQEKEWSLAIKSTAEEVEQLTQQSAEWEEVQKERVRLQNQDNHYRTYQEKSAQLHSIRKEISWQQELTEQLRAEENQLKTDIATLQRALEEKNINTHLEESKTALKGLQQVADTIKEQKKLIIHLDQEQKRINDNIDEITSKSAQLNYEREICAVLVDAFSYRGIPTMIIEEAIPRLEQYANDILSFLSDNTMTIRFSLSRTGKADKETQIETLDILIGDTFGTRAYELFSGGEAFRIDIALRLALTKLLTERSNGRVEFLVIDEGFGSQDDSGQDHIVQIIHKLEKFFNLIIIITHVAQLKETFSDRLLIRKGPQGSEVIQDVED